MSEQNHNSSGNPGEILCSVDDCGRPAREGDLCPGHAKKKRRTGIVGGELETAKSGENRPSARNLLREAAYTLADADSEDDAAYDRADHNLAMTAVRFARRSTVEKIRQAFERRRAEGLPVGRPRTGTSRWTRWRRQKT